jgi:hypothetical protein
MIEVLLQFYGATIAPKISDKTTHIVYDPDDQDRLPLISRYVEKLKAKYSATNAPVSNCYIVTQEWVLETVSQHTELDERDFMFSQSQLVLTNSHSQSQQYAAPQHHYGTLSM